MRLRLLGIFLCCTAAAAESLPPVVVVTTCTCPTDDLIRSTLNGQMVSTVTGAGVARPDGSFVLSVEDAPDDSLKVRLRARDGTLLMARELAVGDASCPTRARSVAVVVHRFLEELPRIAVRTAPPAPPPAQTEAFAHLEPRLGLSLDRLGQELAVGAMGGLTARPYRFLAAHLFGRIHGPHRDPAGQGEVTMSRQSLNLALAAGIRAGPARLEGGVGGRIGFVTVATQGLPSTTRARKVNPAALFLLAVSTVARGGLGAFATVDFYVLGRERSFVVEGLGEVARTSRYGLALAVGLGYGVLVR